MTDAQIASGIALNAWLLEKHPSAKVAGHNELASTACPGQYFRMNELKQGLSKKGAANVNQNSHKVNVTVNGKQIKDGKLDNGVTYVPLRAVGEALGATIGWDDTSKKATITTKL